MPPKTKIRESTTEKERESISAEQAPAAVTAALQVNDSISIDSEVSGPTPISKLDKSCGIGTADIKKLQEAGFCTVESIAFAPRKSLLAVKGISDAKADKLAVSDVDKRRKRFEIKLGNLGRSSEISSHGFYNCH